MEINDWALEKLILDIESSGFQNIEKNVENKTFKLWHDPAIWKDLSGNIGASFVRALLRKLNVDEHHVFRWRPENKYRQYQILNHYVPGCVAETISFSQVLNEDNGVEKIRKLINNGFFIKATLGHRTGEAGNFDKTKELDDIINSYREGYNGMEKWMLQNKLDITEEFRIHAFGKDIIYGLTFIMRGEDSLKSKVAEEFLERILMKLPDAILQGTLIGWDIAVTNENEYYVIEANFTGFHPEFFRGFQTSGYFGDDIFGSIMCAWLNNYLRIKYHVSIDTIEPALLSSNQFYKEFVYYDSLIKNENIISLGNKNRGVCVSAIIYIGGQDNDLIIKLIRYFQEENFAEKYYLVVNRNSISMVFNEFFEETDIFILVQNDLFTEDQYMLVKQLSYERRKKICSYHAMRIIKPESYFMA